MNDHIECKYCGIELEPNNMLDEICNVCDKYGPQPKQADYLDKPLPNGANSYITSNYGRFGYFVMFFPYALFGLMFIFYAIDAVKGTYSKSTGFAIVITMLGVFSLNRLVSCIVNLLSISPRFITTEHYIEYRGILGNKVFMWSDIKSVGLTFNGSSPFVTLVLSTKSRRLAYMLDVSGLKPDYHVLYSEVQQRINSAS